MRSDGGDGLIKKLDQLKAVGFRVLLTGCDGDLLVDRQMEMVKMLEGKGVEVAGHFVGRGYHGVETKPVHPVIKSFIFFLSRKFSL